MTRYDGLIDRAVRGAVVMLACVMLIGIGYCWPKPPDIQFVERYRAVWHTVTTSDTVFRERLRVDTVLMFRVDTLREQAHAILATDTTVPGLRRACGLLDSALTICGERVTFWRARADTVTGQRDSALALARDAIHTLRRPSRCSPGVFGGYGFTGWTAGAGVVCRFP